MKSKKLLVTLLGAALFMSVATIGVMSFASPAESSDTVTSSDTVSSSDVSSSDYHLVSGSDWEDPYAYFEWVSTSDKQLEEMGYDLTPVSCWMENECGVSVAFSSDAAFSVNEIFEGKDTPTIYERTVTPTKDEVGVYSADWEYAADWVSYSDLAKKDGADKSKAKGLFIELYPTTVSAGASGFGQITLTKGSVAVSVPAPKEMTGNVDVIVYHLGDAGTEKLKATVSNGKVNFTTKSFSPFVITWKPAAASTGSPSTGEFSTLPIALLAIASLGTAGFIVFKKRKAIAE